MLCSNILKEKWHKYDTLYELRDHSVDYLALGMSQMFYGINPIYIYDHTGYLGFNLGDEAQNIQFSYFWLVEALKRQSPKAVFLDVGSLFYQKSYMHESWKLKEYAAMPFSMEKIKATIEGTDDTATRIGSLFPIGYFHGNWKHLAEEDFTALPQPTLGANVLFHIEGSDDPLTVNPYRVEHEGLEKYAESAVIPELNQRYFERIVKLCSEESIRLVPVKIPTNNWDNERHSIICDFLKKYHLKLYDLNQEEILIDWKTDTFDTGYHLNYWGACKTSDRLGEYMKELFQGHTEAVEPSDDPVLDELILRYHQEEMQQLLSRFLAGPEKRNQYFNWLSENMDRYIVFITISDHLSGSEEDLIRYFKLLGLSEFEEQHRKDSYVAVIRKGSVVFEKWSKDKIDYKGFLLENEEGPQIEVTSSGKPSHLISDQGNFATAVADGRNYALDIQGMDIVVFDAVSGGLVSSSVHFNDSDWIIQGPEEKTDYLERVLADHSCTYRYISQIDENDEQSIVLKYCESGTYYAVNQDGRCLTVNHAGTTAGTDADWNRQMGDADQLWLLIPNGEGSYYLRSLYNGLLLEADQEGNFLLGNDISDQTVMLERA